MGRGGQVEDGVSVPGLTLEPVACTTDVEAAMCRASRQQHNAASHLVLSVYVACKERAAGERTLSLLPSHMTPEMHFLSCAERLHACYFRCCDRQAACCGIGHAQPGKQRHGLSVQAE